MRCYVCGNRAAYGWLQEEFRGMWYVPVCVRHARALAAWEDMSVGKALFRRDLILIGDEDASSGSSTREGGVQVGGR